MPKVAFTTLGCKVNQFETEVMEGLFKARGYELVSFDAPADVYVINTCSVTHLGERKSRQLIRRAARTSPDAIVVVTGCYAQVASSEVAAIEGVHVIVGTQDRQRIVDLAEEAAVSRQRITAVADIMAAGHFEDIPLFAAPGRTRGFLKIQEGCSDFCSYCIIPYARGPLRSRPLASVAAEAAKLTTAGFKEIVLTGIHLGNYGKDLGGVSLTDAVRTVLKVDGLVRLRLGSLESAEVDDGLISLMREDERLCRHLHLPLQAGDDAVLAAMNRRYRANEFRRLVESIQARVPDIAITTDIIVGFPGETTSQFASTLAFVAGLDLARIHVFPYSRRQGTPAAAMPDQVPEEEKKRRAAALQKLADEKTAAFLGRFRGREATVLFEAGDGRTPDGLTSNYIRVFVAGGGDLRGKLRRVRLGGLHRDGVWGELLD